MCYNSAIVERIPFTEPPQLPVIPVGRMVNYYETLKVSPKASKIEIKSAYRRLARKLHPDKNNGSEQTALAFAAIAEAYEVLGNPKARSAYDKRLVMAGLQNGNGDSVFASANTHAQRWRQLVYEHRYNEIIDRMIAEERLESQALQRFLFPVVALYVSALTVGVVRPDIFLSDFFGTDFVVTFARIVFVSLFLVGVFHIVERVREAFERFTYDDEDIHESILDETELPTRQFSRYMLTGSLILGLGVCFSVGFASGFLFELRSLTNRYLFADSLTIDMLLLPPIFVVLVDIIHGIVNKADG